MGCVCRLSISCDVSFVAVCCGNGWSAGVVAEFKVRQTRAKRPFSVRSDEQILQWLPSNCVQEMIGDF